MPVLQHRTTPGGALWHHGRMKFFSLDDICSFEDAFPPCVIPVNLISTATVAKHDAGENVTIISDQHAREILRIDIPAWL